MYFLHQNDLFCMGDKASGRRGNAFICVLLISGTAHDDFIMQK
jgi:hypothetical protein